MTQLQERPAIVPNISSRLIDMRTRVAGVGAGLVDNDNQLHLEWASPATIGQQVQKLIKQTDDSLHGFFLPPEQAEKLELDMRALLRTKNIVNAIEVCGIFADVSQMDRLYAAHTVASMLTKTPDDDQTATVTTRLAATLGHRRSKMTLMTENRVSLGK